MNKIKETQICSDWVLECKWHIYSDLLTTGVSHAHLATPWYTIHRPAASDHICMSEIAACWRRVARTVIWALALHYGVAAAQMSIVQMNFEYIKMWIFSCAAHIHYGCNILPALIHAEDQWVTSTRPGVVDCSIQSCPCYYHALTTIRHCYKHALAFRQMILHDI